jgi:hypothetical protein
MIIIRTSLRLLFLIIIMPSDIYSQNATLPAALPVYPKIVTYSCFFLPIVSTNTKTTTWNFTNTFSIGFAAGINILYSDRFGISYDMGPVITTTGGLSKVSNFIFDPGTIFRFKKGLSLVTRVAFETAGRYGFGTVLAKAFTPAKKNSLFVAVGMPVRFGNNLPASIGATFFFGIAFK